MKQYLNIRTTVYEYFRKHGTLKTITWILSKVVFHRWSAVVFSDDPLEDRQPSIWPPSYEFSPPISIAALSARQLAALYLAGHRQFLTQLEPNDDVYWITHHEKIVSVGAVLHSSRQCFVLGLPNGAILIGHCETDPAHRKKGLYARAINDTITALRLRGYRSIFMETRPDNEASQKGILRAGLKQEREVHATIFFRSIAIRKDGFEWIKRSRKAAANTE